MLATDVKSHVEKFSGCIANYVTKENHIIFLNARNRFNSAMIAVYLFLILLSGSLSDEIADSKNAKILVYDNENNITNYFFKYKTSNGITREEEGGITRSETGKEILVVRGYYSFIGPDNILYIRRYIADDNGYREQLSTDNAKLSASSRNRIGSPAIASLQGGGLGYSSDLAMKKSELYIKSSTLAQANAKYVLNKNVEFFQVNNCVVLDVGCGPGNITHDKILPILPNNMKQIIGVDILRENIEYARNHYQTDPRISFEEMDILTDRLPNEYIATFDLIVSLFCFHLIGDHKKALKNIYKMLKPGGKILINFIDKSVLPNMYQYVYDNPKWTKYMSNFDEVVPKNHSYEPKKLYEEIGFSQFQCDEQENYYLYGEDAAFGILQSLNMFDVPKDLEREFIEDHLEYYEVNGCAKILVSNDKQITILNETELICDRHTEDDLDNKIIESNVESQIIQLKQENKMLHQVIKDLKLEINNLKSQIKQHVQQEGSVDIVSEDKFEILNYFIEFKNEINSKFDDIYKVMKLNNESQTQCSTATKITNTLSMNYAKAVTRKNTEKIIVTPINEQKCVDTTIEVKNKVDPVKLAVGIENVKNIKKGGY
ncbi:hypothetical protein RN001_008588 [Aquatica leii]|uniref:Methyltransferase domain-containing protein n=1 Tax=Aquatica leii TaxID=1421715 RepID=A0AAN7SGX8_9COLE|nr:hypothetical protein RN001_008588 [Aquatica leii]